MINAVNTVCCTMKHLFPLSTDTCNTHVLNQRILLIMNDEADLQIPLPLTCNSIL